jgi:hypothetical protein
MDGEAHEIHSFADYNRLRCRDDWEREMRYYEYSLLMEFDEQEFSLPTTLNTLRNLGVDIGQYRFNWNDLEPGEEAFIMSFEAQDRYNDFDLLMVNLGSEPRRDRDCSVFGFSIDTLSWYSRQVVLNREIRLRGDAEKALWILPTPTISFFGTEVGRGAHRTIDRHIFILGGHTMLELVVDPESNRVESIHVRINYDGRDWSEFLEVLERGIPQHVLRDLGVRALYRVEGLDNLQGEETPQRVLEYVVPEHLNDESEEIIYIFYGDLYTFPTPLQAFIDNGWVIASDLNVINQQSGWVTLRRDGNELFSYVANLEEVIIPLEYYHVVRIELNWDMKGHQGSYFREATNVLENQVLYLNNVSLGELRLSEAVTSGFDIDSVDMGLILLRLAGRSRSIYDFTVGETIIRAWYYNNARTYPVQETFYLLVWRVELIYDNGDINFPSLEELSAN